MKIIANYLPQFYQTVENDKWWGKGFTDWVSTKNAKILFENHYQPHIPLNNNFYNLLNKDVLLEQSKLMQKYNIYGMCFYHYWFKNGRKILEKPAENLLKWTDIDMPYCFSWANESWTRTWSNLNDKNVWVSYGETDEEKKKNPDGILLKQEYGEEQDWIEHYKYLSPFFKDKRYIKIDNKPIFLIYRPLLIECFARMKKVWEQIAKDDGFNGIYFIGCNIQYNSNFDKIIYQEPGHIIEKIGLNPYSSGTGIRNYYYYDQIWERILAEKDDDKYIYGGVVGFDTTPRKGISGTVIDKASPQLFYKYLKILLKKNEINKNEFTFINAWNEWGEGMHLEPDEKYGYAYLQAVKDALEDYKDTEYVVVNQCTEEIDNENYVLKRYESYWMALDQWLNLKEKNVKIADYLAKEKVNKVAIYGMGMLGKHLINELMNSQINIEYGIDINASNMIMGIPLCDMSEEKLDNVDVIIVTVIYDFDNICNQLKNKTNAKIVSLMEILNKLQGFKD